MSSYLMRASAHGMTARPRGSSGHRGVTTLGRWVLLLALGGLFAMHGLSDHGVGGSMPLPPANHPVSQHMASEAASEPAAAMTAGMGHQFGHRTGHTVAGVTDSYSSSGHGGGHRDLLVGVCLAVLATLLLLGGVAAWRTRLGGRVRTPALDPTRAIATAVRARARGPAAPDLRMLSIQRC